MDGGWWEARAHPLRNTKLRAGLGHKISITQRRESGVNFNFISNGRVDYHLQHPNGDSDTWELSMRRDPRSPTIDAVVTRIQASNFERRALITVDNWRLAQAPKRSVAHAKQHRMLW